MQGYSESKQARVKTRWEKRGSKLLGRRMVGETGKESVNQQQNPDKARQKSGPRNKHRSQAKK